MDDASRMRAREICQTVTQMPASSPSDAFTEYVMDNVFGKVWSRPALSVRDRRWITLSSVAFSGNQTAMEVHVRAALESGDITLEELQEFVLHFAVYNGMPRAVGVHAVVSAAAASRA